MIIIYTPLLTGAKITPLKKPDKIPKTRSESPPRDNDRAAPALKGGSADHRGCGRGWVTMTTLERAPARRGRVMTAATAQARGPDRIPHRITTGAGEGGGWRTGR